MKRYILTLITILTIGLSGTASATITKEPVDAPVQRWQVKPCAQENSFNDCYWDAKSRGNGEGSSFYAIRIPQCRAVLVYWDNRPNKIVKLVTGECW